MSESFHLEAIKRSVFAQLQNPSKISEFLELLRGLRRTEELLDFLFEAVHYGLSIERLLSLFVKWARAEGRNFHYVHREGPLNLEDVLISANPGDVIFLESGVYEGPFLMDKPLILFGDPAQKTLLYSYLGPALEIRNCPAGRIFGLHFQYAGKMRNMVASWVIDSSPHLSYCHFTSDGLTGCEVKGKNSNPFFHHNSFSHSFACGMNILDGAKGRYVSNVFLQNGMHGLSIKGKDTAPELYQNRFEENKQLGVHILDQSRAKIYQNHFLRNKLHGIEVKESACPEVFQNYLKGNEELGIHVMEGGKGTYVGNRLIRNGLHGIEVKGVGSWVEIRDNYCGLNSESGILFQDHASGIIHKNYVVKNTLNGIEVRGKETFPQITENVVYGNRYRGIFVYQEASPLVMRNIVMNNQTGISGIEVNNYPKLGMPQLKQNCVFGNKENYEMVKRGDGDICEDPQFIEPDRGDFRLNEDSPIQKFPPIIQED